MKNVSEQSAGDEENDDDEDEELDKEALADKEEVSSAARTWLNVHFTSYHDCAAGTVSTSLGSRAAYVAAHRHRDRSISG